MERESQWAGTLLGKRPDMLGPHLLQHGNDIISKKER